MPAGSAAAKTVSFYMKEGRATFTPHSARSGQIPFSGCETGDVHHVRDNPGNQVFSQQHIHRVKRLKHRRSQTRRNTPTSKRTVMMDGSENDSCPAEPAAAGFICAGHEFENDDVSGNGSSHSG